MRTYRWAAAFTLGSLMLTEGSNAMIKGDCVPESPFESVTSESKNIKGILKKSGPQKEQSENEPPTFKEKPTQFRALSGVKQVQNKPVKFDFVNPDLKRPPEGTWITLRYMDDQSEVFLNCNYLKTETTNGKIQIKCSDSTGKQRIIPSQFEYEFVKKPDQQLPKKRVTFSADTRNSKERTGKYDEKNAHKIREDDLKEKQKKASFDQVYMSQGIQTDGLPHSSTYAPTDSAFQHFVNINQDSPKKDKLGETTRSVLYTLVRISKDGVAKEFLCKKLEKSRLSMNYICTLPDGNGFALPLNFEYELKTTPRVATAPNEKRKQLTDQLLKQRTKRDENSDTKREIEKTAAHLEDLEKQLVDSPEELTRRKIKKEIKDTSLHLQDLEKLLIKTLLFSQKVERNQFSETDPDTKAVRRALRYKHEREILTMLSPNAAKIQERIDEIEDELPNAPTRKKTEALMEEKNQKTAELLKALEEELKKE